MGWGKELRPLTRNMPGTCAQASALGVRPVHGHPCISLGKHPLHPRGHAV